MHEAVAESSTERLGEHADEVAKNQKKSERSICALLWHQDQNERRQDIRGQGAPQKTCATEKEIDREQVTPMQRCGGCIGFGGSGLYGFHTYRLWKNGRNNTI